MKTKTSVRAGLDTVRKQVREILTASASPSRVEPRRVP